MSSQVVASLFFDGSLGPFMILSYAVNHSQSHCDLYIPFPFMILRLASLPGFASLAGSRKFGMCYVDNEGRLAAVGTTLEIVDFAHVKVGCLM
jgi:hypothetical protein